MPEIASRSLRHRGARGFTLIEIMVADVIKGTLAARLVPKLLSRRGAAARVEFATAVQALKLYKFDNQRHPSSGQGLPAP